MNNCDNCSKELARHIYCSDKCRKQHDRKADTSVETVRNTDNKAQNSPVSVRKADKGTKGHATVRITDTKRSKRQCIKHKIVGCTIGTCM